MRIRITLQYFFAQEQIKRIIAFIIKSVNSVFCSRFWIHPIFLQIGNFYCSKCCVYNMGGCSTLIMIHPFKIIQVCDQEGNKESHNLTMKAANLCLHLRNGLVVACFYMEVFKLHLKQNVYSRGIEIFLLFRLFFLCLCSSLKMQKLTQSCIRCPRAGVVLLRSSLLSAARALKVNVRWNCSAFTTTWI